MYPKEMIVRHDAYCKGVAADGGLFGELAGGVMREKGGEMVSFGLTRRRHGFIVCTYCGSSNTYYKESEPWCRVRGMVRG